MQDLQARYAGDEKASCGMAGDWIEKVNPGQTNKQTDKRDQSRIIITNILFVIEASIALF